jgi:peptidoglycan/LPS O-acetylase OafA/YrhL
LFTIIYTAFSTYKLGAGAFAITVFKNIVTAQGKMILYYLPVYMQLVLLTPLLAKIAKQKKLVINFVIMAISPLFILCFYLGVLGGVIYKEMPWYMMFFPVWLSYYYLGILIGNKLYIIKTSSKRLIALIAIGLILQIAEGIFWLHNTSVKDMYFSQIRFTSYIQNIPTLLLIARYISSKGKRDRNILVKIGDASFGVYLLHPAFIMVCDKILARTEATFVITFVVAFAGSFATVLVLNKIIPRKALKYTGLAIK